MLNGGVMVWFPVALVVVVVADVVVVFGVPVMLNGGVMVWFPVGLVVVVVADVVVVFGVPTSC